MAKRRSDPSRKTTSDRVARLAGKSLRNPRTTKRDRSIDASALAQHPSKRASPSLSEVRKRRRGATK